MHPPRWFAAFLVCLACFPLWLPSHAAEPDTPARIVKQLIQAIGSFKTSTNGNLSAADRARNAAAARTANAILDIPGVSQWALGKHWQNRSQTEQQEFIALLAQLFEKVAYPKSAEFFTDLEITIDAERIRGERAVVRTTVMHPKEGLVSIDYRLIRHDNGWRVRDILLDDVSLATNLRSQFNKIITEESYADLVRRMREKLAEETSDS